MKCLSASVCPSVCPSVCLSVSRRNSRMERSRKPKIGMVEAHHTGIPVNLFRGQKVKDQGQRVTKCKSIPASTRYDTYVCGGRIFEQPCSTAMLFHRSCSFALPPVDCTQAGALQFS